MATMGTDENGYITNHDTLLEVTPLKTSENYKLGEENPDMHTDSEDENSFCACLVLMKPQRLHRDRSFATEIDVFTVEIYFHKPGRWKWCHNKGRNS